MSFVSHRKTSGAAGGMAALRVVVCLALLAGLVSACKTRGPGKPRLRLPDDPSETLALQGDRRPGSPKPSLKGEGGGEEEIRAEDERPPSKTLPLRRGWWSGGSRESKAASDQARRSSDEKTGSEPGKGADAKKPAKAKAPSADGVASAPGAGVLRPGLEIWVSVMVAGKKEIDEPCVRVADDGTLRLPMIGAVDAAGISLLEFSARVAQSYREFFVDPQVSVDFVNDGSSAGFPWGSVTVLGRVGTPGRIALPPTRDLTVIGAIQAAGGFAASARDSSVRITRRKPDGKADIKDVDLRSVGSRGRVTEDMILKDGDIIYVPERIF